MTTLPPLLASLLAGLALGVMPTREAKADTVTLGAPTAWGHPFGDRNSNIRGLAYDGRYYYVADALDHFIDKRPRDETGRIYIYDREGKLVKRLPEVPPVRGSFFPHGVATDGVTLWTTDYFGGNVYEYDIASGALKRQFRSPVSQPIRMDYQASTRTLWMTGYGNPRIFQVDLAGTVLSTLTTSGFGPNLNPALDGRGDLWAAGTGIDRSDALQRVAEDGTVLQRYTTPGWTSIATNIHDRRSGYVRDLPPVFNAERGRWEARLQHVKVDTVGGVTVGLDGLAVRCTNVATGQSVDAHPGAPARWNCLDAGLAVNPGDAIRIEVSGTAR